MVVIADRGCSAAEWFRKAKDGSEEWTRAFDQEPED